MNSIVETAIRGTITKGLSKISGFNRARAKNTQGPHPFEPPRDSRRLFDLSYAAISVVSCIA